MNAKILRYHRSDCPGVPPELGGVMFLSPDGIEPTRRTGVTRWRMIQCPHDKCAAALVRESEIIEALRNGGLPI